MFGFDDAFEDWLEEDYGRRSPIDRHEDPYAPSEQDDMYSDYEAMIEAQNAATLNQDANSEYDDSELVYEPTPQDEVDHAALSASKERYDRNVIAQTEQINDMGEEHVKQALIDVGVSQALVDRLDPYNPAILAVAIVDTCVDGGFYKLQFVGYVSDDTVLESSVQRDARLMIERYILLIADQV